MENARRRSHGASVLPPRQRRLGSATTNPAEDKRPADVLRISFKFLVLSFQDLLNGKESPEQSEASPIHRGQSRWHMETRFLHFRRRPDQGADASLRRASEGVRDSYAGRTLDGAHNGRRAHGTEHRRGSRCRISLGGGLLGAVSSGWQPVRHYGGYRMERGVGRNRSTAIVQN